MRQRGRQQLPARAAASPGSRPRSSARWSSARSMASIDSRSKLRPILLPNEAPQSSQQGTEWQGGAREHAERRGRVAARWVEAAHLLLAIDSTFSKILSAESRCAGSDNARALSRLRTAHRLSTERILRHSHGAVLCRKNASGLVR
eukprot:5840661-Prymnesium_polylepis.1